MKGTFRVIVGEGNYCEYCEKCSLQGKQEDDEPNVHPQDGVAATNTRVLKQCDTQTNIGYWGGGGGGGGGGEGESLVL